LAVVLTAVVTAFKTAAKKYRRHVANRHYELSIGTKIDDLELMTLNGVYAPYFALFHRIW